jgi:hypothetical protein
VSSYRPERERPRGIAAVAVRDLVSHTGAGETAGRRRSDGRGAGLLATQRNPRIPLAAVRGLPRAGAAAPLPAPRPDRPGLCAAGQSGRHDRGHQPASHHHPHRGRPGREGSVAGALVCRGGARMAKLRGVRRRRVGNSLRSELEYARRWSEHRPGPGTVSADEFAQRGRERRRFVQPRQVARRREGDARDVGQRVGE